MYDNEKKNITLVVEDTKAPVIEGVKDYEMLAYEKVPNFLENVTVSDNSMEEITPKIEGEYDSEKVVLIILNVQPLILVGILQVRSLNLL